MPPWAAMPFTAAHMANSRTPKKMLRPAGSLWKLAPGLKIVSTEKLRLVLSHRGGFFAARIIVQCFDRLQGGFGQQR